MKILMVLTSHDRLGDSGQPTGFWLEEFAAPYYVFKDAGEEVVIASPRGGRRRSTRRATIPARRPRQRAASAPTRRRRRRSPRPCGSPT
jgi:putative intracellular protease/amidase